MVKFSKHPMDPIIEMYRIKTERESQIKILERLLTRIHPDSAAGRVIKEELDDIHDHH